MHLSDHMIQSYPSRRQRELHKSWRVLRATSAINENLRTYKSSTLLISCCCWFMVVTRVHMSCVHWRATEEGINAMWIACVVILGLHSWERRRHFGSPLGMRYAISETHSFAQPRIAVSCWTTCTRMRVLWRSVQISWLNLRNVHYAQESLRWGQHCLPRRIASVSWWNNIHKEFHYGMESMASPSFNIAGTKRAGAHLSIESRNRMDGWIVWLNP